MVEAEVVNDLINDGELTRMLERIALFLIKVRPLVYISWGSVERESISKFVAILVTSGGIIVTAVKIDRTKTPYAFQRWLN